MKASERIESIIARIPYNGFVLVKDLARMFNVTEETIRRDISRIMEMSIGIRKVHGGVFRVGLGDESSPYKFRSGMLVEEKKRFANYCVSKIKPRSCVMLDSSTTSLFIARKINLAALGLTLVTNSLAIAQEFENNEDIAIVCAGGVLRKSNCSMIGPEALSTLDNYCADCCFVSPTGIDLKFGLIDNSEGEAAVRRRMLELSARRFLVVDRTKFGVGGINRISDFSSVDEVVTDAEPSQEWKNLFESNNIPVRQC